LITRILIGTAKICTKSSAAFAIMLAFVFEGPLSKLKAEEKAGWLGTWTGPQDREIIKTLQWKEGVEMRRSKSSRQT